MSEIKTYTGKMFDPVSPDKELIDIRDIAHALSLICRGNGHVSVFYSVAQHCIYCAKEAMARGYSDRIVLACLLHDASEAYMSDLTRPVKECMPEYRVFEDKLLGLIYSRYLGTPPDEKEIQIIREIDDDLLYLDLKHLLAMDMSRQKEPEILTDIKYEFRPFDEVEEEFLDIFTDMRV